MRKGELINMLNDYKDAVMLVTHHIKENPTSSDIQLWTNALHRLKSRLAELEECLHLGEYDE
tara:strand:+ start:76 stop:261 length:186 start_codon:yes stop_codon:yes gene_type:complete